MADLKVFRRYRYNPWLLHDDLVKNRINSFRDDILSSDVILLGESMMDLRCPLPSVPGWACESNRGRARIGMEMFREWLAKNKPDKVPRICWRIRADLCDTWGHHEHPDWSWYTYGFPRQCWATQSRCYVKDNAVVRDPGEIAHGLEEYRVDFAMVQQRLRELGWTFLQSHDDDLFPYGPLPWYDQFYNPVFRQHNRTWTAGAKLETNLSTDWLYHLLDYIVGGIAEFRSDVDMIQVEAGKRKYAEAVQEWYRDKRVETVFPDGSWRKGKPAISGYKHLLGWLWNDPVWIRDMQSTDDAVVEKAISDFQTGSSHLGRTTYTRHEWDVFHLEAPLVLRDALARHKLSHIQVWDDYPAAASFVTYQAAFPDMPEPEAKDLVFGEMARAAKESDVVSFPGEAYTNYLDVYREPITKLLDVVDSGRLETVNADHWRAALGR